MKIDSLGNCPSTLLPDPMSIDDDSLRAYVDATAAAGFDSMSLWAFHLKLAGPNSAAVVRDSGLKVEAVEAAIGWTNGPTDGALGEIDGLIEAGTQLGARIVGAAMLGPMEDVGAATEGLAAISAQADDAGMIVALEFLPWAGVPTFAAANDLVVGSGAPNATVLLDTWHWVRQPGGPDLDALRSVPGARIAYVQMGDPAPTTTEEVDVETEAMADRRLPGSGTVDYASIWAALDAIGSKPFVAAEVFSTSIVADGAGPMAAAIHDACRAQLP